VTNLPQIRENPTAFPNQVPADSHPISLDLFFLQDPKAFLLLESTVGPICSFIQASTTIPATRSLLKIFLTSTHPRGLTISPVICHPNRTMAQVSTNEFKAGLKVEVDGEPYTLKFLNFLGWVASLILAELASAS
jgi:hypothetical protein